MERFLICNNPKCHFVLDRRINGKSFDGAHLMLKKCPDCGGDWGSACPSCARPLAMKLVAGLPQSTCDCKADVRAAQYPLRMAQNTLELA
jgi:hypothetical protein